MFKVKHLFLGVILLLVAGISTQRVQAASSTFTWIAVGAGNWSNVANWSHVGADEDGIPDTDDFVIFDSTSTQNAVIDVDFAIAELQVEAGYTGAIQLGSRILTVSGGFSVANASSFNGGTGTVRLTGSQTVNSAASLYELELATADGTLTLTSDLTATHLTIESGGIGNILGSGGTRNINITGDVTSNDPAFTHTDSQISLISNVNQTLSGTGVLVNLNIAKAAGDVLIGAGGFTLMNGSLTGGTRPINNNAGGLLTLSGDYTVNYSGSVDDLVLNMGTLTLEANLAVDDDLTITSLASMVGVGGTRSLTVFGDITSNDATFAHTDSQISLISNVNQTLSGTGVLVNLNIAKAAGDVLIGAGGFTLMNGSLTGGTRPINNDSGGLLTLSGDYTVNYSGSVDDVVLNLNSLTLESNLTIDDDLTITNVASIVGSGGTRNINITGDVTSNDPAFTHTDSQISLTSNVNQTLSGTGVLVNLNIAKAAGDVLIGAGGFTLMNGSLTGGTRPINNNAGGLLTLSGDYTVNYSGSVDDLVLNMGTLTLEANLAVDDDLTITSLASMVGVGGTRSLTVFGDITSNDATFAHTDSQISLISNVNQTLSGTGVLVNLNIAKTGGEVLIGAGGFTLANGSLTGGPRVVNNNAGGLLTLAGNYTINYSGSIDDMELDMGSGTLTLETNLTIDDDLTITDIGSIVGSGGTLNINVSGDVTSNDSAFTHTDSQVSLVSNVNQQLLGSGILVNLNIAKTGGGVLIPTIATGFTLSGGTLSGSTWPISNGSGGMLKIVGPYTFTYSGTISRFEVVSGQLSLTNSLASQTVLVDAGATLFLDTTASLTAQTSVTNNGMLRQTRTNVPNATTTGFLRITNQAATITYYYGVDITPNTGDMGVTTVEIDGNQVCDTHDSLIHRCFDISPTTAQNATIRFWYLNSERNGQIPSQMSVYHWDNGWTVLDPGGEIRSTVGVYESVEVDNVATYSPFGLATPAPTALTLTHFAIHQPSIALSLMLVIGLLMGTGVWWVSRRR